MSLFALVALISIVMKLSLVQIPLDLRARQLSRRATIQATVAITLVIGIEAVVTKDTSALSTGAMGTLFVAGMYGLLHRASPKSLGWGDVLLVAPLTLAVAYVAIEHVLWWQLLASVTGALHAVAARVLGARNHVPFGPHLLFGAWLMLLLSI